MPARKDVTRDMKRLWILVGLLSLPLLFLNTTVGPQLALIGLTLGIFFGTLSLGKPPRGEATSTNPGH